MNFLSKYFNYLEMKSLISEANESIYSEQFNFEVVFSKIASKSSKLKALIAIHYAVNYNEPLKKVDIIEALNESKVTEKEVQKGKEMDIFLNLLRDSVKLDWLKKTEYILNGKLAYKTNKYSFEGTIYSLEKEKKGPVTLKEREKWELLSKEIIESEENLNRIEQEILEKMEEEDSNKKAQLVLDNIISEMNERRKNMSDEEIQEEIVQARLNRLKSVESIKKIIKENNK